MNDYHRSAAYAAMLAVSLTPFFVTFGRLTETRALADATVGPPPTEGSAASQTSESVILKWPEAARVTAREMTSKYGAPNRFSDGALVWIDNGPWRRTVVYRNAWPHFLGRRDKDYLEQTIAYRVPPEKIEDLKRFDRRLEIDQARGQLSARSESEAMNFLALNLADEIVSGKREVDDARDFMAKTESLGASGKSSKYTKGFLFPNRGDEDSQTPVKPRPAPLPQP